MGKRKKPNYHNNNSATMKALKVTCLKAATSISFSISIAVVKVLFLELLQDVEANLWPFLLSYIRMLSEVSACFH